MRHRQLDLNLLIPLQALLEHRSVTRAALAVNVSQSTMSGILQRLRDSLGDPLLVQVGRHMRLTPLAESLIGPSQHVLDDIDSLLETQAVFDPATVRSRIVIATSDYVVSDFLGDLLARIAQEAPRLRFVLAPPVADWGNEMDAGRVDYVICPAHVSSSEHPSTVLFEDTYTVVAWAENRPTRGIERLSLERYQSLGHVIFHTAVGRPWFEQWYTTEYGESRRIEMLVSGFNMMPALVIGTDRIATVQTRLARRAAAVMPLKLMALPIAVPPLVEVVQWSRHREADPVHKWVLARLLAGASELAAV
ncbi:LysR family transcriptional regulator [Massilia sp. METH4]|uniref:LysR family transcriptional regulator n=1 Tax=Massilia sp. METH4 TaxID=3123041 RepID=UPI0030D317F2